MKIKNYTTLILTSLALIIGCNNQETSTLKENASPTGGTIVRVMNPSGTQTNYVLVSQEKGYLLSCPDLTGLSNLIRATGVDPSLLWTTPAYAYGEYDHLKLSEQPVLSCNSDGKTLYFAELDGIKKFFFEDSTVAGSQLFMIGCHAMVGAMGLEMANALEFDPNSIDFDWVSVADEDDINCVSGVPVSLDLTWEGENEIREISPGADILGEFRAKDTTGAPASVSIEKEGYCSWLGLELGSGTMSFSGVVPTDFVDQQCSVTVVAESESSIEESRTITFRNTHIVWYAGSDLATLTGAAGDHLLANYIAYYSHGKPVELSVSGLDTCPWLTAKQAAGSVSLLGVSGVSSTEKTCEIKVTAAAGTALEESKTLTLTVD